MSIILGVVLSWGWCPAKRKRSKHCLLLITCEGENDERVMEV
jgi:hypothetical protein